MNAQLAREIDELSLRTGIAEHILFATIALSGSTNGKLLMMVDENGEPLPWPVALEDEV